MHFPFFSVRSRLGSASASLVTTLVFVLGLSACPPPVLIDDAGIDTSDGGFEEDAGNRPDAGGESDAGPVDSGVDVDAGNIADAGDHDVDAGPATDAGVLVDGGTLALSGFGSISGACSVIEAELHTTTPSFFVNHIDFGSDPYDDEDSDLLTAGGREIIADGNAGGSSVLSEVFSFEVLARCEAAVLLKTETEVLYDEQGKITDLLVEIDAENVGVSVTRAVGFPREDPYTQAQATNLLEDKLADILVSSANVSAEDAWNKQILHVIAYAPEHVASLEAAWETIDDAIRSDTIVLVTVSDGADGFLY